MAKGERPEPENVPFALAALLGARTWAEVRRVLEEHPELLSDEGLRLFNRGLEAVRGTGAAANPHLPLFEEQQRLLVRCREVGVEAAFAELDRRSTGQSGGPALGRMPEAASLRLMTALREFTGAGGLDERRSVLARHPELLTAEAVAALDGAIEAARNAAGDDFLAMLQAHRQLLIRCRDVGIPAAFAELGAGGEPAEIMDDLRILPPHVIGALRELGRLDRAEADDDERRAQLYEAVIAGAVGRKHRRLRATMQAVLGRTLLLGNVAGDRSGIVERAIRCFEAALTVLAVDDGADWGTAQHLLGLAYRQRTEGEHDVNAGRAIACFEAALLVRSKDATPVPWATTQHELGYVYWSRRTGDRPLHLERAIACFSASLEVFTPDRTPRQWGAAKHNLGNALLDRVHGDPADDVERAIVCYEEALRARARDADSGDWAATMVGLGAAFQVRIRGERADNLERAIACCRAALEVYGPEHDRVEWIRAQRTLAGAYAKRVLGEPDRNWELATAALRQALAACPAESLLEEWAGVQYGLGILLSDGTAPSRSDEAIACFEAALTVWTPETAPDEWAATQVCLGATHAQGPARDRETAMEAAIECYKAALAVQTVRASVLTLALTTHNLAAAYSARVAGDSKENLATAARLYEQSLAVLTPERFPVHCRAAGRQLGDVLAELGRWPDSAHAYERAMDGAERIYQASLLEAAREAELAETSGLHQCAAIAMVRAGRVQDAVVTLERSRARGLGEVLARDRADLTEIARLDPDAVEAYQRAASAVRALEQRGVPDPGQPLGRDGEATEAARQAQVALQDAVERIRRLPDQSRFLAPPDWSNVAAAVTETTRSLT